MNATLDTVNGQPTPLRFERRLRHAPEKVWKALTDPAELTAWFPQNIEGTFAPGAKLRFVFRGEPPVLDGKVIEDFTGPSEISGSRYFLRVSGLKKPPVPEVKRSECSRSARGAHARSREIGRASSNGAPMMAMAPSNSSRSVADRRAQEARDTDERSG